MGREARVVSVTIKVYVSRMNKIYPYDVLLVPVDPFVPIDQCLHYRREEVELAKRIGPDNIGGFKSMVVEMAKVERLASGLLLGKFTIKT